ncbi:hypothetical protein [Streptomyces sp. NRRL B-1347]|uniref:hypothetical protein n=1 Tax=Streptomyces sp. NRRL B-1347 TaxID=1476877 RepID=UPI0004C8FE0D|nr:hypothetical protein [Streptomyces sp. NRRL B-1347]
MTEPGAAGDEQPTAGEPPACAPQGDAEHDEDQAYDGGEAGEEPRRRAFAMPDLRPYADPRPLAELGPLAVEACQSPSIRIFLRVCGLGVYRLLAVIFGWVFGRIGKRGSVGARLAATGFIAYALARAPLSHPVAVPAVCAAVALAVVLAGTGRLPLPTIAPGPKGGVSKVKSKRSITVRFGGSLWRRTTAPEAPSADTPPQAPGTPPADQAADVDKAPVPDPSPEAVIRALHRLVGEGRGVLHTTLRDHLALPDTRALKRVLERDQIPSRPGVRAAAGNGPGVHRDDFPPLPPLQEPPQGTGVVAGQQPTPTPTTPPTEQGEGAVPWTEEERRMGRRLVRAPHEGPAAWKVERLS